MTPPKRPWWTDLITQNPMMAEVTRFRKRFLSFRGSSVAVNGGIGIVLVCYALFAVGCVYYRGDLDPLILIIWFLGLMIFAIPLMLHGAIAGERERRSWDMLLVAPITHAQIVIGKFMGAMTALGMAFGLYMIPVLIDAVYSPNLKVVNLLLACITVIMQGAALVATTILISGRVKRPLIALGVSIGIVLTYYFFVPIFISSLQNFTGSFLAGFTSPFTVIQRLMMDEVERPPTQAGDFSIYDLSKYTLVFSHFLYQLVLTVSILTWAMKTLIFADNEVKFIPKKKANVRSQEPS